MANIYDIRGTHGSGKSYLIHQLLENRNAQSITRNVEYTTGLAGNGTRHMGVELVGTYLPDLRTAVLGTYLRNCGGCDQIKTAAEIERRLREFADMEPVDNVILEGILVAHTHKRYSKLATDMIRLGHSYTFVFINVDLDECIRRVQMRRMQRGKAPEFDLGHITQDHALIHTRVHDKMVADGHSVKWIDGTFNGNGPQQLLELLTGEGV